MSLAEAQSRLASVQATIDSYYAGTLRKTLRTGTHEFNRQVEYVDIKIDDLLLERSRLQTIIDTYIPPAVVLFKDNNSFPLVVTKKPTDRRNNNPFGGGIL